jgi:hypothetical protein
VKSSSLSSSWTPLFKWYALVLWLVFPFKLFYDISAKNQRAGEDTFLWLLMTPFLLWIFFSSLRKLDEVTRSGDQLVLRRRGEVQQVPLVDILNVQFHGINPTIVRLWLRLPGPFGQHVQYFARTEAPSQLSLRNLLIERLILDIDAAKCGARS